MKKRLVSALGLLLVLVALFVVPVKDTEAGKKGSNSCSHWYNIHCTYPVIFPDGSYISQCTQTRKCKNVEETVTICYLTNFDGSEVTFIPCP